MTASARVPRVLPTSFYKQENPADRSQRFARITAELEQNYEARFELNHRNAFEMLVATLLAARSLDSKVNELTPELFRRYPDPAAMAGAQPEEIEPLLQGLMGFRNKSRHLVAAAQFLCEKHNGEVPQELEALTKLPGVGHKTAVMVLGACFDVQAGIPVDTHVARTSLRLALTESDDTAKVETALQELAPQNSWTALAQRLVFHGRYVCTARKPKCERCPLNPDCPSRETV